MEPTIFFCWSSSKTIYLRGIDDCKNLNLLAKAFGNIGEGKGRNMRGRDAHTSTIETSGPEGECLQSAMCLSSTLLIFQPGYPRFIVKLLLQRAEFPRNYPKNSEIISHTALKFLFKVNTFLYYNRRPFVAIVRDGRQGYSLSSRVAEQICWAVKYLWDTGKAPGAPFSLLNFQ